MQRNFGMSLSNTAMFNNDPLTQEDLMDKILLSSS